MVRVRYSGVGDQEAAIRLFDGLAAQVELIRALQANCWPRDPDDMALQMAVEGLETAAYHFTRRPRYYEGVRIPREHGRNFYPGLGDRESAIAAFAALKPLWAAVATVQQRCRPFGRDYLALEIAKHTLTSAAYHFTRIEAFFGAKSDSAGPVRAEP